MSFSQPWRFPRFALLLLALPAAAEPVEVKGKGYAADSRPESFDPPAHWTDEQNEHDPDEGVTFADTATYELRQGAGAEDRQRHRSTDYIHWEVHGAVLVATGQVQDADKAAATIATSQAWGKEEIAVHVEATEGQWCRIWATNTIQFSWDFLVSGSNIGEASVQLQASATDIQGRSHSFSYSAQSGESVSTQTDVDRGVRVEGGRSGGGAVGISGAGASAVLAGQTAVAGGVATRQSTSISKRFPKAGGETGHTEPVVLKDEVTGATPMSRTYEVSSEGSVTLRARAGKDGSAVVVLLNRFKVDNELRAFKEAWVGSRYPTPGDPPPPSPPSPPGPTTPGGGGPGAAGNAGGNRGPWEGGTLVALPTAPHGLDGETGAVPGTLRIRYDRPASRDATFEVVVEPASALDAPARLTLLEGRTLVARHFHAIEPGTANVSLRMLDDAGAPNGVVLMMEVEARSVAEYAKPAIWATAGGWPGAPGRTVAARGLAGEDVGPLVVGRRGYASIDTEATTLTIETDDPAGILPALPATVTIPAGEATVALPLRLNVETGRASLRFVDGERTATVLVSSVAQGWTSIGVVRVPLGAVAPVPFVLDHVQRDPRAVQASSGAAAATLDLPIASMLPGERTWYVEATGAALGSAEIELTSDGLPPLRVPIEVVPVEVEIVAGRLELRGLDGSRAGAIRIAVPEGARFVALTPPETAEDYLEIEGLGTREVVLSFTPSPDLPAALSIPLEFEGDAESILVYDTLHLPEDATVANTYRIAVR